MVKQKTVTDRLATGPLLVGGFLVMIVLMVVLEIGAIRVNENLVNLTDKIYHHPLAVSNAVQEANANIIAMHRHMKDVALARKAGELETAITSVSEYEIRVYKNFELILERFLGDKSKIEQARKTFTGWQPIRSEVIELTRNGQYDEAAEITKGKGARYVAKMSSQMGGLVDFAQSKALQFLVDSKQEQGRSQAFLYGMFAVVVLVGSAIAYIVVVRVNRTEGRILGAMNEAKQANDAKSDLLSSMSHDLRTPLNAIVGFSDMMLHETHGPLSNQKYKEYIKDIKNSGLHLVHMVNDILDLARVEAGHYEIKNVRLNLGELLSNTLHMVDPLVRIKGLKTALDVPDDLPDLWGDQRAILQILTNLIANAIKFTPEGGSIKAQAYRVDDGAISIVISDNGIGMDEKELANVMEPFYRGNSSIARREEGAGLGLHVCHKLVGLLDATMDIQSGPSGTFVTVMFPKERNMELRLGG